MYKIYIFGAGISGTITALALAYNKIPVALIDAKTEKELQNPNDPRTTAIAKISKDFLNEIGIWEKLQVYSEQINDIFVCQNMSDNILHMKAKEEELGHMVENNNLRRVLLEAVKSEPLINLICGTTYHKLKPSEENTKFSYYLNGEEIQADADLCIISEGKFSNARKLFFFNAFEKDYKQKAIVFNIEHSKNHEGGAIEHFLYRGPFATLPLKGGYQSSIVWTEETNIADFLLKKENEDLEILMAKFIGEALGDIKIITKPQSFPLSAFITDKYYYKKLVLIADSAHVIHPLAGQGLNIGIKDIIYLTNNIKKYTNLGLAINDNLLVDYEKNRKKDNKNMLKITDNINSVFSHNIKTMHKITQIGLSWLDSSSFIKDYLINYAKGIR